MHMADALISPAVGGTMWAATAGLTYYSARKLKQEMDDRKLPLMGVLGAFVFAAQMINFTIPATGSSGHLVGGIILSILLGPYAAFLTLASVFTVQALFFADGGLLALGCNIFNMGFFACFIAYPLVYKKIVGDRTTRGRILQGALAAAILSVLMGAFAVVLETLFSGISELPFFTFMLLMLPIHLAIGVVEGLITAAVVTFVWKARPEILELAPPAGVSGAGRSFKPVIIGLVVLALFTGGLLSWFASTHPDGLEWSIQGVTGKEEVEAPKSGAHGALTALQEKLAFLPDYDFRKLEGAPEAKKEESWPDVNAGRSLAGVLGGAITLLLVGAIGFGLKKYAGHHG